MTQNLQGADLIGKTIVVNGSNVKYVIKSVDGDKLMTDFIMGDRTMPCPVPMSQVESMVEAGKWTIEGSEEPTATETKAEDVKHEATATEEPTATEEVEEVIDEPEPAPAQTVKMKAASEREQSGAGSDYAEREQARPQVKTEMPKDKAEEKGTTKKSDGRGKKSDTSHQHSALKYETYTTKRGKTGAKIVGFRETDAAYLAGPELHGSKAWENDKQGNKTFCLLFSHRYAKAAEDVCKALNAGKSVADCQAIIDGCTEERAQKREEWKQKREERNANGQSSMVNGQSKKLYTEAEVRKAFKTLADASGMDVKEFEPIISAMRVAA